MSHFQKIIVFLILSASVFLPIAGTAGLLQRFEFTKEKKTSAGPESSPFTWSIENTEKGLVLLFSTTRQQRENEEPGEEGGWEYLLEINDINVLQGLADSTAGEVKELIPSDSLENGRQEIVLTVRDMEGNLHVRKGQLRLDTSPQVTVSQDSSGQVDADPQVTFSFWGEESGVAGMVDFCLDERLVKTMEMSGEQASLPQKLSNLLGDTLKSGDLLPGNHLLQIVATGLNGSVSRAGLKYPGNTIPPEVTVTSSKEMTFREVAVVFPECSSPLAGSIEIYREGSLILAVQAVEQEVRITRKQVLDALALHNHNVDDEVIPLVISSTSANQVQDWQLITFQ